MPAPAVITKAKCVQTESHPHYNARGRIAFCDSWRFGPKAGFAKFRWIALFVALFAGFLFQAAPASAGVVAKVDIATQRMTVIVDGNIEAVWAVSTARRGYYTPRGVYQPKALQRMHYSKKYHNSPMPYSVFFKGGYAVHGTYEIGHLGKAASHGCIRLAPGNAAALYQLIRAHGISSTQLEIS